jgi:hypothetical protein
MKLIELTNTTFRLFTSAAILAISITIGTNAHAKNTSMLIDDFSNPLLASSLNTTWSGVADTVMGGVSKVNISHVVTDNESCLNLIGDVSLDNNGGFIQAALNLATDGGNFDTSEYTGIRLVARGNDEQYSIHLRTADNIRPWQSYRAQFIARPEMQTFEFPFSKFQPYRITAPLNLTKLRRIGLVAIGREFHADLTVCRISLY